MSNVRFFLGTKVVRDPKDGTRKITVEWPSIEITHLVGASDKPDMTVRPATEADAKNYPQEWAAFKAPPEEAAKPKKGKKVQEPESEPGEPDPIDAPAPEAA